MALEKLLATKLDPGDARAFSAIAKASYRTESAELRRLVRAYVRGQVTINDGARQVEPAGQPQEVRDE